MIRRFVPGMVLFLCAVVVLGQANGSRQPHFIEVEQAMVTLLSSAQGETVLVDDGVLKNGDKPLSYPLQLDVAKIDYHVTSHYVGRAAPLAWKTLINGCPK